MCFLACAWSIVLSIGLSIGLSIVLSIHLSNYLSFYLSICLPIYRPMYLFVDLSFELSIVLSIDQSIDLFSCYLSFHPAVFAMLICQDMLGGPSGKKTYYRQKWMLECATLSYNCFHVKMFLTCLVGQGSGKKTSNREKLDSESMPHQMRDRTN